MKRVLLLLCVTIFSFSLTGSGQEIVASYNVGNTAKPGLSDQYITALEEDQEGNIWVGTKYGGVNKWDGITYENFYYGKDLPSSTVNNITVGPDGKLWIATDWGIAVYDHGTWVYHTYENGYPSDVCTEVLIDHQDSVWAIGLDYVMKLGSTGWRVMQNTYNPLCIYEDSKGVIWVNNRQVGMQRFDGVHWDTLGVEDGLPGVGIYAMEEDKDHNYWFATSMGLYKWTGTSWETIGDQYFCYDIQKDVDQNIYAVFKDRSLKKYNGETFTVLVEDIGSPLNFHIGTNGKIYLGYGLSLRVVDDGIVTIIKPQAGLSSNNIQAIYVDDGGKYWIGTELGYHIFDGDNWDTGDLIGPFDVHVISSSPDKKIWIGAENGLFIYNTPYASGSYTKLTTDDGLVNDVIYNIRFNQNGGTWLSTNGGGIYLNGSQITNYTESDGLIYRWVNDILEDGTGNIWFATIKGISRFGNGTWTDIETRNGLPNNWCFQLEQDNLGNIYVATNGGSAIYQENKWTIFDRHYSGALAIDPAGTIWIAFNNDLKRYNPNTRELNSYVLDFMPIHSRIQSMYYNKQNDQLVLGTNNEGVFVVDVSNVVSSIQNPRFRSLTIFPNPAHTQIQIEVPDENSDLLDVRLISLQGHVLQKWIVNNTGSHVNVSCETIPSGIYLIEMRHRDQKWTGKVSIVN